MSSRSWKMDFKLSYKHLVARKSAHPPTIRWKLLYCHKELSLDIVSVFSVELFTNPAIFVLYAVWWYHMWSNLDCNRNLITAINHTRECRYTVPPSLTIAASTAAISLISFLLLEEELFSISFFLFCLCLFDCYLCYLCYYTELYSHRLRVFPFPGVQEENRGCQKGIPKSISSVPSEFSVQGKKLICINNLVQIVYTVALWPIYSGLNRNLFSIVVKSQTKVKKMIESKP